MTDVVGKLYQHHQLPARKLENATDDEWVKDMKDKKLRNHEWVKDMKDKKLK